MNEVEHNKVRPRDPFSLRFFSLKMVAFWQRSEL